MLLALRNPVLVVGPDDGLTMIVGDDGRGRLIEVGVVERDDEILIVHPMPARNRYLRGP